MIGSEEEGEDGRDDGRRPPAVLYIGVSTQPGSVIDDGDNDYDDVIMTMMSEYMRRKLDDEVPAVGTSRRKNTVL